MMAPGAAARRWWATAFAAFIATWTASAPADASLPAPPFAVSMDVSPDGAGNRVTVRVEARPVRAEVAPEPFDLSVVQLQGFQEAVFLTASGSWSPRPVSVYRGLPASGFAPIAVGWTDQRFGSMHLIVIAARAGSDPLVRSNWLFRPILRNVPLRARLADDPRRDEALLVTGLLGGLSAVAVGFVLWLPRMWRPGDGARRTTGSRTEDLGGRG